MSNYASAARYAKALLDVIIQERGARPEQVEQELATYADLFAKNDDLRKALLNPAVPLRAKRAVIEQLNARINPSKPLAKLMLLLAERERFELIPDLMNAYRERLMEYQQVVGAEVVTAMPLPDAHAERLQQRLTRVTGRKVTMTTRIDESIIGGVVARIGSTVYDGSVRTQLAKIKEKLTEA